MTRRISAKGSGRLILEELGGRESLAPVVVLGYILRAFLGRCRPNSTEPRISISRVKHMQHNNLLVLLKGVIVGGTMLVPGVSGGSMAMILGVYDRLVFAVSSFMKQKRKNFIFLVLFAVGAGLGMVLFSRPLLHLLTRYPMPVLYFFFGTVAGGVPLIVRRTAIRRFSWRALFYIVMGILAVFLFQLLPTGTFQLGGETGFLGALLLLLVGILSAVPLVLPGISISYLLLLMGLYERMVQAISTCDLRILVPFGVGLLIGTVLTAKALEYAMTVHPHPTYLGILGFILGSMAEVFPGIPSQEELLPCVVLLAAGFLAIRLPSRRSAPREGD